jgi:hypothetical protein
MNDLTYPLIAIRDDGETIVAHTEDEARALRRLRPQATHVNSYRVFVGFRGGLPVHEVRTDRSEWIVRDDAGRVVHGAELPDFDRGVGWYGRRLRLAQEAADRGLPIPGSGKRSRYRRGFRAFRINTAMRAAEAGLAADLDEWGVSHMHVGRTRSHLLPQVCDDVQWRSNRRCWKDTRSTRWR